jgi:hypothetical protein
MEPSSVIACEAIAMLGCADAIGLAIPFPTSARSESATTKRRMSALTMERT